MTLPRNAGNHPSFSPKRIAQGALMSAFPMGQWSVEGRGQFHGSPRECGGLEGSEWTRNRTRSSVPGNPAKSLRLESTYRRIRNLCSVNFCVWEIQPEYRLTPKACFKRPAPRAHTLLTVWSGQSDHRLGCSGFCSPGLSKLPYANSLLSQSLCSFHAPHPFLRRGLG